MEEPTEHDSPALVVSISRDFNWSIHNQDTVSYSVSLISAHDTLKDIGRLTYNERFTVIYLIPDNIFLHLINADQAHIDAFNASVLSMPSDSLVDSIHESINVLPKISSIGALYQEYHLPLIDSVPELSEYTIEIATTVDGIVWKQEVTTPKMPMYTWGKKVEKEGDACKGKLPEECAQEKLKKLIEKICSAKKADNTLRFPEACERLKKMQEKTPSEPKVVCMIDGGGGMTNPSDGTITVNGDYFLSNECAESVIIHEISHSIDAQKNTYPHFKDFNRLLGQIEEVLKKGKAYNNEKDATKKASLLAEYQKEAGKIFEEVQKNWKNLIDAIKEQIEGECKAYFNELNALDFLKLGDMETQWVKADIKSFVSALYAAINRYYEAATGFKHKVETAEDKGLRDAFCECFKKIRDFVNAHNEVKENLKKDKANPESSYTYMDLIDAAIAKCK